MNYVYKPDFNCKPIKCWLNSDDFEPGAAKQAENLSRLPFTFHHVALMPDCHQGYGMPIGGVLAVKDVVIPNAVGVDIGCGMLAFKTPIKFSSFSEETYRRIVEQIKKLIPTGFNHRSESLMSDMPCISDDGCTVVEQEYESATHQLGTLGGGNHFIELQKDGEDYLWVMIHSGSRNLGKKVADHYNSLAKKLNSDYYCAVPSDYDLAFLPLESKEGRDYLAEMTYCLEFATKNREYIAGVITEILTDVTTHNCDPCMKLTALHNYAAMENHFGSNVLVHRKGAIRAREGDVCIIPGSQGTKSYIARGLGNPDSFTSCSHGAGRRMGRKAAINNLDFEEQKSLLDHQGIIHDMNSKDKLDEASGAYKDITVVMDNQKDLVEIVVELSPIAVIKG